MKVLGAITNVKRPANGDNFGKASIEHVLMSYPKRLDAYIPDAGEVVAVVSSKWMEGKGGGKNWVALEMQSCQAVNQLTPIQGIARIHTSLVLSEIKSTTALPLVTETA